MPVWARVLEASEAWGIPPWDVVKKANAYWWKRFLAYQEARAIAAGLEDESDGWEALEREFGDSG